MMLSIDLMTDEPIYQQIRQQIVQAVADGELVAGDPLPSVRSLAADLGINMHTVNKAYALLRDEGYVVMRRRSGAIVADRNTVSSPEQQRRERDLLALAIRNLAIEHKAKGGSKDDFMATAEAEAKRVFTSIGDA
ncbi:MAG: GntR family transcriptional regulator [Coriobacteriales bacterium]|nr:GntR family transcriptional regulator [Coriobacteriales bacterium]